MRVEKITYQKMEDIIPYENNPRQNELSVEHVANSISEFGFNVPIVVDKNNIILAGHTRYKASQLLGLEEVPTLIKENLTSDQAKAFRLADNKAGESSTWDEELLIRELKEISDIDMEAFGFEELEFEELDIEEDIDDLPEPPEESDIEEGDIFKLGEHYLMCGDATKIDDVKTLVDAGGGQDQVDLYLTDPPYNVDYSSKTEYLAKKRVGNRVNSRAHNAILNDSMGNDQFLEFLTDTFIAVDSVLKKGGAFYIWHADSEGINFRRSVENAGWQLKQTLIWVKNQMTLGRQDYQWRHEPCLYGWKEGASHYFISDRTRQTVREDLPVLTKMSKKELIRLVKELLEPEEETSVIKEDKPQKSPDHPTMKPINLFARLIYNSTRKGEIVLDTFGGSGTTLIACEQLKRRCRIMELDPIYCDVIIRRWEELTGEIAQKMS